MIKNKDSLREHREMIDEYEKELSELYGVPKNMLNKIRKTNTKDIYVKREKNSPSK